MILDPYVRNRTEPNRTPKGMGSVRTVRYTYNIGSVLYGSHTAFAFNGDPYGSVPYKTYKFRVKCNFNC